MSEAYIKQQAKQAISITLKETIARAKADMKDAIHDGRVVDGCRKRTKEM